MARAVRVFAAHVLARHVEHHEVAAHGERNVALELPGRQIAAHVVHEQHFMQRDAFDLCRENAGLRRQRDARRVRLHEIDVAGDVRWVPLDDGIRGNRARDDCAGCHGCPFADRHAAKDRRVHADRCTAANPSFTLAALRSHAGRRPVVGERGIGSDEYIVVDANAIRHAYAAANPDAVADYRRFLDERVIAEIAIRSHAGARQDVRECRHSRSVPDRHRFAQRVGMHEYRHWRFAA
jgi:hypothetical protein